MIQPQELRIGNWIQFYDEGLNAIVSRQLTMKDFFHAVSSGIEFELLGFEGIDITEKWLSKFGLEPNGVYKSMRIPFDEMKRNFIVVTFDGEAWIEIHQKTGDKYQEMQTEIIPCRYVHTLQNIYFSLKGQELTLLSETKEAV